MRDLRRRRHHSQYRVPLSLPLSLSLAVYVECEAFQLIAGIKRDGADEAELCVFPLPLPSFYCMDRRPPPHASTDVALCHPDAAVAGICNAEIQPT